MSELITDRPESVKTLAECEAVIKRGLATFVEVGEALMAIRDNDLYREKGYERFEDYCRQEWQWTRQYVNYQIQASKVTNLLKNDNHGYQTPETERQARELVPLMQDEAAMVETWNELKETYGDKITAAKIKAAVQTRINRENKEDLREAQRQSNRDLVENVIPVTESIDMAYQTIVLDPPWDWGDEGDCDQFGRARPAYATMNIEEIAALPVPDLADCNCHLYLWITNRSLPKGFDLIRNWGFRYITMLTWCKPSIGMGNYYRGSTEQVLFAVRGSLPLLRNDIGTWFTAQRPGEHSAKPECFYNMVEQCSPGPWLEMFARNQRPGWKCWGAEA